MFTNLISSETLVYLAVNARHDTGRKMVSVRNKLFSAQKFRSGIDDVFKEYDILANKFNIMKIIADKRYIQEVSFGLVNLGHQYHSQVVGLQEHISPLVSLDFYPAYDHSDISEKLNELYKAPAIIDEIYQKTPLRIDVNFNTCLKEMVLQEPFSIPRLYAY